jgi:16S rRNA (uracil1498-N3)-methyltransferase
MSARYFAETPISGDRIVLEGAEAAHLVHVMRAVPGTEVVLFDGSGAEFPAQVTRIERGRVELAVLGRREVDRELPVEVTLAVALPKGDRQRWLVEKAVELGVRRLVPLVTDRSVARPTTKAIARLRRTVIEASKQCGRNRLMDIAESEAWADFAPAPDHATCLLARPAEDAQRKREQEASPFADLSADKALVFAVGPEGGFTREEIELALTAPWQAVDLGPRILRVETAAILLVAMVTARFLLPDR